VPPPRSRCPASSVSTPGIVAGAPTSLVPEPRLPAAATTTTSFANAWRNASSQLSGQSRVLRVSDMLITSAPLSTAQRTASAICSSFVFSDPESCPKATDAVSSSASGATPITPLPSPVPRPARSEATIVPCSLSSPTGVWPSGEPMPEASVPPTTTPRSSVMSPLTPVSMIATFTPSPRDMVHACV
jgi:hypothetical protein